MKRAVAVFLALFAVYAATIGLDSFDESDYGGDEPHYLLAAESLIDDGDLDVKNQYVERSYSDFYPYDLDKHGVETEGRLHEPHGIGFPLLIAPAMAIGGEQGVELFMAALAALAVMLAYLLALRVAPDPWALGAAAAVGLSAPLLAYGSAVYPELAAGAALAGAAVFAVRLDAERRRPRLEALACFLLLGSLPWLGTKFVPVGLVIGVFAVRALMRHRRKLAAIIGVEVALFATALLIGLNEALYGGPTPYAADAGGETVTDAGFPLGYLERSYRLAALFIDRDYGLLRWAPVLALAGLGAWLLYRTRRDRLEAALPGTHEQQLAATICAAALGAGLLVAVFLAPTMFGFWFPGRHILVVLPLAIPLVAWGLRQAPRLGSALAALSVVASLWLYLDVLLGDGGFALDRPDAPFGPLTGLFPFFGDSPLAYVVAGVLALALAALFARDARHWRHTAGATRDRYSG